MEINKKEQVILNLLDYLYEEAFLLDREVIGETNDYIRFLDFAYESLIKVKNEKDSIATIKEYVRDTILNSDSLTVQMLYSDFNKDLSNVENKQAEIIDFRKVI